MHEFRAARRKIALAQPRPTNRYAGETLKTKLAALLTGASLGTALVIGSGIASADTVGDASQPNCHVQRVSHGAKSAQAGGHELTPVERRDIIETFPDVGSITVGEWNKFIKTCPPPQP